MVELVALPGDEHDDQPIAGETDREKFVRLATKRVQAALKAIQLIGNLSNKSNYDWRDEDVRKIFAAIEAEMKSARSKFSDKPKKSGSFSLEP